MSKSNGPAGEWIEKSLVWQTDGLLYFTRRYLERPEYASVVSPMMWQKWVDAPCTDLDPRVNGGRIRHVRLNWRKGQDVFAYLQADVKEIIRRRTDAKARTTDPAEYGEWLNDQLFQLTRDVPDMKLRSGEILCRDDKLADEAGVSDMTPVYWRRYAHAKLDPAINEGKLRSLRVPKLGRSKGGRHTVPVSSRTDWKKIMADRLQRRQQALSRPASGQTAEEIATELHVEYDDKSQRLALSFVLRSFREQVPNAAHETTVWSNDHNQARTEWRYDLAPLRGWLGKRSVQNVAEELRRLETPRVKERRQRRLRKAVAFLQFVLTEGKWRPRAFQHFLASPPFGKELRPCEGVPSDDIKRWARDAGVSIHLLWAAKKALPIGWSRLAPGQTSWRLTELVKMPEAPTSITEKSAKSSTKGAVGRPAENADLVAFALNLLNSDPKLRNKDVLKRWREQDPNHPIFENTNPQAALRAALSRERSKAKKFQARNSVT